ncbi:hypothetical protein ACHAXS_002285 [Conticribra weissflogii]
MGTANTNMEGDQGNKKTQRLNLGRVTGAVEGMVSKGFGNLTGRVPREREENVSPVPITTASASDDVSAKKLAREKEENKPTSGDASAAAKPETPSVDGSTVPSDDDVEEDETTTASGGIVFHNEKAYKFSALYWRHGLGIPENGKIRLGKTDFTFKGLLGTLSFDLRSMEVEKASRMGGLVNDAFRVRGRLLEASGSNAGLLTQKEREKGEKDGYLFTAVLKDRKEVLEKIREAVASAKKLKDATAAGGGGGCNTVEGTNAKKKTEKKKPPFQKPPPDPTLQKMTIIGTQVIKNVSLQDYYEVAWSEGKNCDKPPMYGPFLVDAGKNNVQVNPWEAAPAAAGFKGEWCGETYTQQRTVTFNFMKQTIGQTLVEVKHTHRCRRDHPISRNPNDPNDSKDATTATSHSAIDDNVPQQQEHIKQYKRIIVQMTLEMKGFPYADCFVVEVRHVTSRINQRDIQIEIGMLVRFLKSCMFEGKIRNNTGAETTKAQLELLGRMVEGCQRYAVVMEEGDDDEVEEEEEHREEAGEEDSLENAMEAANDNNKNETASKHQLIPTPIPLPEPIIHILRTILMLLFAAFRSYVRPYIQSELLDPFPPATVDEALESVEKRIELLEEICDTADETKKRKKDVERELKVMRDAMGRIRNISNEG